MGQPAHRQNMGEPARVIGEIYWWEMSGKFNGKEYGDTEVIDNLTS